MLYTAKTRAGVEYIRIDLTRHGDLPCYIFGKSSFDWFVGLMSFLDNGVLPRCGRSSVTECWS
ncbi:hypothetical protein YC2023_008262 [Brassica napus]